MTREEAINKLVNARYADEFQGDEELTTAHLMAIKALKQEPCEDAISRKEVMNQIFYSTDNSGDVVLGSNLRKRIEKLPSVTPTRKKGKWEFIGDNCFKCSECGEVYTVDQFNHINNYCNNKFPKACPNCATEMESEE